MGKNRLIPLWPVFMSYVLSFVYIVSQPVSYAIGK
jgi:uncharacterized membrane protein